MKKISIFVSLFILALIFTPSVFASSGVKINKGATWWVPLVGHAEVETIVIRYRPTGYQEDCVGNRKCLTFDHKVYKPVKGESILLIFGEAESLRGTHKKYCVVVEVFNPYYVVSIAVRDRWGNVGEFSEPKPFID